MQELANKVAVITGAASGIGEGLARRFAVEGMKLVLADIEEAALLEVEKELRKAGSQVLAVQTDVSHKASVFALADQAFDAFGNVHIVCNNAGVSGGLGHIWEIPDQDWEWIMAVNLNGVLYGMQAAYDRERRRRADYQYDLSRGADDGGHVGIRRHKTCGESNDGRFVLRSARGWIKTESCTLSAGGDGDQYFVCRSESARILASANG